MGGEEVVVSLEYLLSQVRGGDDNGGKSSKLQVHNGAISGSQAVEGAVWGFSKLVQVAKDGNSRWTWGEACA